MTIGLERRVNAMCNIAEGIAERAYKKGYKQGVTKAAIRSLTNLMDSLSISLEQAMDILETPLSEREKYIALLNQ